MRKVCGMAGRRERCPRMCRVAVLGAFACLIGWSASLIAQDTGTLVGRIQAKRAAVVFLEVLGQEEFGKPGAKPDTVTKAAPADTRRARLDQKQLTFVPHVLAFEGGTVIDFLNSDDLLHNIHLYRGADMKTLENFAIPFKGLQYSYKFNVPGEVVVLCDVHAEMSAYILVLPNKYFVAIEGSAEVNMKDISPGSYMVKVWREGTKKLEQTKIDIKPGVNVLALGK